MGFTTFGLVPFTAAQAREAGIDDWRLRVLCEEGCVRRLTRSVYVATEAPDTLALRCAAARLVVSPDAVVTDRTAAWLHGAKGVLRPNADLEAPEITAFHRGRGGRVRRAGVFSGQRTMPDSDVMELHGLAVTTPVRTMMDLGRQRNRFHGIAGIDAMARIGTPVDVGLTQVERFKGYRGVRNLRTLLPLADGASESALRLHWYDAGLPRPQCQIPVSTPWGTYYLDLGHEELGLVAEYDGAAFHEQTDAEHDDTRRGRVEKEGWTIVVARNEHVYGPRRCADKMLREGAVEAKRAGRRRRGLS